MQRPLFNLHYSRDDGGTRDGRKLLTLERCVYVEGWSCFVHSPPSSHGCAVALTSAVSRGSGGQSSKGLILV